LAPERGSYVGRPNGEYELDPHPDPKNKFLNLGFKKKERGPGGADKEKNPKWLVKKRREP